MKSSSDIKSENMAVRLHRRTIMGRRVRQISENISSLFPAGISTVLDVGAGTGEMAVAINQYRQELKIMGADVYIRPKTFIPVEKYDGSRLPFEDGAFDAVMTVDVLHHCNDPVATLKECSRVARKWVVVKDHISNNWWDAKRLRFMDWVGNRAHGVVLPYNYLSALEWDDAFSEAGLELDSQVCQIGLYPQPFEFLFGGSLHGLYLLRKIGGC